MVVIPDSSNDELLSSQNAVNNQRGRQTGAQDNKMADQSFLSMPDRLRLEMDNSFHEIASNAPSAHDEAALEDIKLHNNRPSEASTFHDPATLDGDIEMQSLNTGARNKNDSMSEKLSFLRRGLVDDDVEEKTPKAAVAAVALLVVIIGLLTAFVFSNVHLATPTSPFGTMATWSHTLYVAGTTALATAASIFVSGQVKRLWLSEVLHHSIDHSTRFRPLRRARVLLGLGELSDYWKLWDIVSLLTIIALMTTAIVAGITPSKSYYSRASALEMDVGPRGPVGDDCMTVYPSAPEDLAFSWQLSNGSYYGINQNVDPISSACQVSSAIEHVPNAMQNAPSNGWAYYIGRVPVPPNALGVPISLANTLWAWPDGEKVLASALVSVSGCVPVLTKNPVRCRTAGSVSVDQQNVTVMAEGCSATSQVYKVNPQSDPAAAAGACTDGLPLGQASLVFGAVNGYAGILASTLNDKAADDLEPAITSYSAVCDIDVADAFELRGVSLRNLESIKDSFWSNVPGSKDGVFTFEDQMGVTFTFTGDDAACEAKAYTDLPGGTSELLSDDYSTPLDLHRFQNFDLKQFLTPNALFTGAAASTGLLSEAAFQDGWWPTLNAYAVPYLTYWTSNVTNPQIQRFVNNYNFADSRNGLEDALGTATAIAISSFYGGVQIVGHSPLPGPILSSRAIYEEVWVTGTSTTIGPGSPWALVFLIPEIVALVLLIWLMAKRRRRLNANSRWR